MLVSGEEPLYIARRLIRMASEDIGMADSAALPLVLVLKGCAVIALVDLVQTRQSSSHTYMRFSILSVRRYRHTKRAR